MPPLHRLGLAVAGGRWPALVMALLAAVVLPAITLTGCSSGGSSSATTAPAGLRVDLIGPAVEAVRAARGGQALTVTEVNAAVDGANVFVATGDGQEIVYHYRTDGTLEPPGSPSAAAGASFSLDGVRTDLAPKLFADLVQRFPGSQLVAAALVKLPDQGLVWALRTRSAKGGELNVFFGPDGALRGAADASSATDSSSLTSTSVSGSGTGSGAATSS